jgi:hypothetical protein
MPSNFNPQTLNPNQAVGEADFLGPLITISSCSSDDASSSSAAAAAAAALAKLSTWNPDIKEILCEEGGMQVLRPFAS